MDIREGIFDHPSILALIDVHADYCLANTPVEKAHRLSLEALNAPDIRFWTLWEEDRAIGCVALRDLGNNQGEVKSMHVLETHRGQPYAEALLNHLINEARSVGMDWLGLETGASSDFHRAIAFYRKHGFDDCPPFGNYTKETAGVTMSRNL